MVRVVNFKSLVSYIIITIYLLSIFIVSYLLITLVGVII